jgi:mono/diheme cytochrome c family protein
MNHALGPILVALAGLGCSTSHRGHTEASHDAGSDATRASNHVPPRSSDASIDAAGPAAEEAGIRPRLSETGLYRDIKRGILADGVRAYSPGGVLWADGAAKTRWVYLPPGAQIDTSNMDYWVYPVGTKIWKEFSLDGARLETRLIEKVGAASGDWALVAYQWNVTQEDAVAVPGGVPDAGGTDHDIPSESDCHRCHDGVPDDVLGFTALELSHDGAGVTLSTLIDEHVLTTPPPAPLAVPGDATARTALLYLHANCGQCHSDRSLVGQNTGARFFLPASALGSLQETPTYESAVGDLGVSHSVASTKIILRMTRRGPGQMPPLATKHVDGAGVADIAAWLTELLPQIDSGLPEGGSLRDGGVARDAGSRDR